jgi:multicomponent Na+:H+ antiporter subunit F
LNAWLTTAAIALVASLALGLFRVWRGPSIADRMLAAQLLGTTGIAVSLVMRRPLAMPGLTDVALVLALLAVLAVLGFVARVWDPDEDPSPEEEEP